MFRNMGTHVMQFPSGRWGFVGSLPVALGAEVPASTSDVLGCRTHRNDAGDLMTWKFPTFATESEAREHAKAAGVTLSN